MLLGLDPSENPDTPLPIVNPQVTYAYTKHLWTAGDKMGAYK